MLKTIKDVFAAIAKSNPVLDIDTIQPDGDVVFTVKASDLGLAKADLTCPFMRTRFIVNVIGEFLVRTSMDRFADILTGLDPSLYERIVNNSRHKNFGMMVNHQDGIIKFQMHLSLVEQILTEQQGKIIDDMVEIPSAITPQNVDETDDQSSEEP